jgi:hypothetical protein
MFLSSQITLIQKAIAEYLSAMHQLEMTEFVADLDRFLAELTIYSTLFTVPSSLPGLFRPPLYVHIPAEIEVVSPQAILPFLVEIPFVPSPPPLKSPLGCEKIKAAVEAIKAVHNSVSVTSDDDEHLEGIDPAYQSPSPSPSVASTASASSFPPTTCEIAILNLVEARLNRELDLPVDRSHRFYHKACFTCRRLSYICIDCAYYKCPLKHCPTCPSPSASTTSTSSSRSSYRSAQSG